MISDQQISRIKDVAFIDGKNGVKKSTFKNLELQEEYNASYQDGHQLRLEKLLKNGTRRIRTISGKRYSNFS